jgi:hypothetical protein
LTNAISAKRHPVRFFHSILRSTFKARGGTRLLLLACVSLSLACCFVSLQTQAGTSPACECNRNAPDILSARWLPNSTMRVHFRRGDFSSAEIAAFQESIRLWQAVLPKSGTGISLQMGEEITGNNCTGCIIVKRKADMRGTFAALSLLSTQGDLYSKAVINIKADVHKIEMLRMLLTHELGHAFGLDDCPECGGNTTVMNSVNKYAFGSFSFFAPRNKMSAAPTACDVARVAAGYAGASRQLSAAVAAATTTTTARAVQFIKAQDRTGSRSLSYEPIKVASSVEMSPRNHAGRAASQPQRSFKIVQLALMDALSRRD